MLKMAKELVVCKTLFVMFHLTAFNTGSNTLIGDVLCLSGAALYGISNVAEEFLVKKFSRIEYLGMIGLFGSLISGVQL